MKTKKVIKALNKLRENCKFTDCRDCLLSDKSRECLLMAIPVHWDIEQLKINLKDKERI